MSNKRIFFVAAMAVVMQVMMLTAAAPVCTASFDEVVNPGSGCCRTVGNTEGSNEAPCVPQFTVLR
jgi:hypothetical protein